MNKLSKLTLLCAAFAGMMACSDGKIAKGDYGIIPLPQEVSMVNGSSFVLTPSTSIIYPEGNDLLKQAGEFLASYIKEATGYAPKVGTDKSSKPIHLSVDKSISNPEGYRLTVTPEGIEIAGASEAGVFYGVQTLRKSIPAVAEGMNIELPAVTINDYPRFAYRGMHLDVSRHFFPADSIKKYIDILALHNMNTLHWHLTDDQGWRIEIKKYPELTTIGSQRKETVIGRNSGEYDGKPYGGFYTQDEIRDVIGYAKERFVTIIPEIDLPGHQQAALAAYPDLGCTGGPYEVWTQWGISDDVICAGNDKAMQFLEDVLSEVIDLFPSEYIHIGGDECPKVRWKTCPKCQARIKAEGIKGDQKHSAEEYLQSYVISRMEKFVESKGRHIIGWDEILEGGLAPNATVMSWRGVDGGIEAAKQHHNVIMTPNTYLYFDYYQSTDTENEPLAIGGYLPLERVYSLEPTAGIPDEYKKYVIGVQSDYRFIGIVLAGEDAQKNAFLGEFAQWCQSRPGFFDLTDNVEGRRDLRTMYGALLFLGILFGLIFFMCLILIMYYKQITEGYEDRNSFDIMQKVGMSDREIRGTVRRQILMVFGLPLAGAVMHTAAGMVMVKGLMEAVSFFRVDLLFWCTVGVIVIFMAVYGISYMMTAKTYYRIVRHE